MKLPGIDYDRPVQSLGRHDVNAPLRVASAEAQAKMAKMGFGLEVAKGIDDHMASAEYNRSVADYQTETDEMEKDESSRPYSIDEDTGESKSRHDSLKSDYDDREKEIYDRVLAKMSNGRAIKRFRDFVTQNKVAAHGRMNTVSLAWKKSHAKAELSQAIDSYIKNGDYYQAEAAFVSGAAAGVWTQSELNKLPGMIAGHEQYTDLDKAIGETNVPGDLIAIREDIDNESKYEFLSDKQRKTLRGTLTQKIEDSFVEGLRNVIETKGQKEGYRFIHAVNKTDKKGLGFTEETDKFATVTRLQQVYKDYEWESEQNKSKIELNEKIQLILATGAADRKHSVDKKAVNAILEAKNDGAYEFSPEWNNNVRELTNTFGWVPPDAESRIRAYIDSTKPQNVVDGANLLGEIMSETPYAVDHLNRNDFAFALTINEFSQYGVPEITVIDRIRKGIYGATEAVRKDRLATFKKDIRAEAENFLKDEIDADDEANPFWKSAANYPPEMKAEFNSMLESEYMRTGNAKIAAKIVYSSMRSLWGVSNRSGSLKLEKNSPEARLNKGARADWIDSQYKKTMKDAGLEPDDYDLVFDKTDPGKNRWIVFNKETMNPILDANGTIKMMTFDRATSPQGIKERKEGEERLKQANIRHERLKRRQELMEQGVFGSGVWKQRDEQREFLGKATKAINEGAIDVWSFLLDEKERPSDENYEYGSGVRGNQ